MTLNPPLICKQIVGCQALRDGSKTFSGSTSKHAEIFKEKADDAVQCNVNLRQMDKDYNDFIPSLRAYSDGGSNTMKHSLVDLQMCRGLKVSEGSCNEVKRYMAVDAWESKMFGMGSCYWEALIKEAHSYFEQALQSGVLSSATRSLAVRVRGNRRLLPLPADEAGKVDEEKLTIEKLKAEYEKENG
eukprot:745690-Hanusia_phi.AAC.2